MYIPALGRQKSHTDADTQNRDPHNELKYLKIPINPPYLKPSEPALNNLGLPIKKYYTTKDVGKVLNMKPDTFRYRLKVGYYPESRKIGGKRKFSERDIHKIVQMAKTGARDKIKMQEL